MDPYAGGATREPFRRNGLRWVDGSIDKPSGYHWWNARCLRLNGERMTKTRRRGARGSEGGETPTNRVEGGETGREREGDGG